MLIKNAYLGVHVISATDAWRLDQTATAQSVRGRRYGGAHIRKDRRGGYDATRRKLRQAGDSGCEGDHLEKGGEVIHRLSRVARMPCRFSDSLQCDFEWSLFGERTCRLPGYLYPSGLRVKDF